MIYRSVSTSMIMLLDLMERNKAYIRFEYGTVYAPLWAGIRNNIFYLWILRCGSSAKNSFAHKSISKKQAIEQLKCLSDDSGELKYGNFNASKLNTKSDSICCFTIDPIEEKVKVRHIFSLRNYPMLTLCNLMEAKFYYLDRAELDIGMNDENGLNRVKINFLEQNEIKVKNH